METSHNTTAKTDRNRPCKYYLSSSGLVSREILMDGSLKGGKRTHVRAHTHRNAHNEVSVDEADR